MVTLKVLLERHPEWGDLPLVVYTPSGRVDWVGESSMGDSGAGGVYVSETPEDGEDGEMVEVLVFTPN